MQQRRQTRKNKQWKVRKDDKCDPPPNKKPA